VFATAVVNSATGVVVDSAGVVDNAVLHAVVNGPGIRDGTAGVVVEYTSEYNTIGGGGAEEVVEGAGVVEDSITAINTTGIRDGTAGVVVEGARAIIDPTAGIIVNGAGVVVNGAGVGDKARVGNGCRVGDGVIVIDSCRVGDDAVIGDGSDVSDGCRIGNGCEVSNGTIVLDYGCGVIVNDAT